MKKSLGKNYIFNLLYQIFVLIVPLVTAPYISRVLKPSGVGMYSFTDSLQNYFCLFASLGFAYYAQREIARYQGDKINQSKIFWEIIIVRSLSVSLSLMGNLLLCFSGVYGDYTVLMAWWNIMIISNLFDIMFLFQGNEEFGKICLRNFLVKIISVICVFIFVKTENDVYIYVLISSISILVGNMSMWAYLPKLLSKVRISSLKPFKHLKPALCLFLPNIASSVYTIIDKSLLGFIIKDTYVISEEVIVDGEKILTEVTKKYSDLENGYYEQSQKIIRICTSIITALGIVMIPRNSKLSSDNNDSDLKKNVYFATNYVWILGLPIVFGLISISNNFVPWFLGDDYNKCILLLKIQSPIILLIGFANVFGLQYLIAIKKDKYYSFSIIVGAVINIILNIIFIYYLWSVGAVIASIIAEFFVCSIMYICVRKDLSLKRILFQSLKPLIASIVMFIVLFFVNKCFSAVWYYTLISIIVGGIIYLICLLILKDKFIYDILKFLLAMLKKKKASC